jgi:hypothetical protein
MEASQELEAFLGHSSSSAAGANYMLVIAEDQPQQQQQQGSAAAGAETGNSPTAAAAPAAGSGLLGVLAVDVGSGDIAYGLCSSMLGSSSSSSNVVPLAAVLLSLSPAELVVCEPASAATNRQLAAYMAGVAGRRCRLERLQQQQQQQQSEAGSSKEAAAAAAAGPSASNSSNSSYLTVATLQTLSEFYSSSSSGSDAGGEAGQAGQTGQPSGQTTAAADAGSQDPGSGSSSSSDDLNFILSLPHLVLVALAGALRHLQCYDLTGVLRCTSGFRSLGAVGSNMMLDGNALRQLEVLAAGEFCNRASLLHLLLTDLCSCVHACRSETASGCTMKEAGREIFTCFTCSTCIARFLSVPLHS